MSYGLYVHIPFCIRKCNYCDFVSFSYTQSMANGYIEALGKEMALYKDKIGDNKVRTIYIGGGTPTCLSIEQLERLLDLVKSNYSWEKGTEYTVEANPGTLDKDKLAVLKDAGVNRLSIGAQSFSGHHLQRLGRVHSAEEIEIAVLAAREAGFDNINLDLIFGLPDQTLDDWRNTIEEILRIRPEHISAYGLKIEEGTPFHREKEIGLLEPCDEEVELAMYDLTIDSLEAAGYKHYEISNFALAGRESLHNLSYWHNEQYLGLGLAAYSFLKGTRWSNICDIDEYVKTLDSGSLPRKFEESIPPQIQAEDAIFLGLRTLEGLDLDQFKERYNIDLTDKYRTVIEKHTKNGLLEVLQQHLRLTRKGLFLSNAVMVDFISD